MICNTTPVTKQNISPEHPQRSNNPRKTEKKNYSRMMYTIAAYHPGQCRLLNTVTNRHSFTVI